MTQLKANAQARLRANMNKKLPEDSDKLWPLTEEEVQSAYRSSPTMKLTFQAVYGQKEFRIISPSTHNVRLAMIMRLRFDKLFEEHRNAKAKSKLHGGAKGKENADRIMLMKLDSLKKETTAQVARDKYDRGLQEKALITAINKELASRSSTDEVGIAKRQAELNDQATAALRVRDALGLDHQGAKRAVSELKKMSAENLKRARAMLMGRLRPSLLDNSASASSSAGKRRRMDGKMPVSSAAPGTPGRTQSKATQSSSSSSSKPPKTAEAARKPEEEAPEAEEAPLPPPGPPQLLCCPLLPSAQLGGNPRAVIRATLAHAVLPDWCTLRATAASIRRCADEEFRRCFEDFTYSDGLFQWEIRSHYTGRARPTPTSRLASRLTRFLAAPRHVALFAHLDLGMAPMDALQDDSLTKALGKMSRLEDVVFPNQGWASGSERGRFLAALPAGTNAWGRGRQG